MIELSVSDAFAAVEPSWVSGIVPVNCLVGDVSTDTRTIAPGDLFVALSGPSFSGTDFVESALAGGASGAICENTDAGTIEAMAALSRRYGVPIAVVNDAAKALGRIGAAVRAGLRARVIAITGSCGKTSTKSILAHMLAAGAGEGSGEGTVTASAKSFNNHVGVPRTLFDATAATRYAVLEVGTNAPGEIAELASIASPHVALITMIGRAHLEGLGTLEGVAAEKSALVAALDSARGGAAAVLNARCPMTSQAAAAVPAGVQLWTFSGAGRSPHADLTGDVAKGADVFAQNVRTTVRGTECEIGFSDRAARLAGISAGPTAAVIPLLGAHAASNVAAALAGVLALGGDVALALGSIGSLKADPHRMQPSVAAGVLVIDDAYNANPDSFGSAIQTLSSVVIGSAANQRVLVAGPMGEMGADSIELHRETGRVAGTSGIDRIVLVAPNGDSAARAAMAAFGEGAIEAGLDARYVIGVSGAAEAVDALVDEASAGAAGGASLEPLMLRSGDACLVKASRAYRLEDVVKALVGALASAAEGGARSTAGAAQTRRDQDLEVAP